MLYDLDMPLFNKELSREEFDRKVRENPMNDHLKVSVLPAEEKAVTGENEAQNDTETVQDFSSKTGYENQQKRGKALTGNSDKRHQCCWQCGQAQSDDTGSQAKRKQ